MMRRPIEPMPLSKLMTLVVLALAILLVDEKETRLFACTMYAQRWDGDFRAYWGSHGWRDWGNERSRWEFTRCMAQYGED